MYELTKQKSRGYWIIFGVIAFAFISLVLKIAFYERPRTVNEDLVKAANEINKQTPITIDSMTRFDYVYPLNGKIFQYNYTLTTLAKSDVDTVLLKTSGKESMIRDMKENPQSLAFKNNDIEIQVRYSDRNGAHIATISIYPSEY